MTRINGQRSKFYRTLYRMALNNSAVLSFLFYPKKRYEFQNFLVVFTGGFSPPSKNIGNHCRTRRSRAVYSGSTHGGDVSFVRRGVLFIFCFCFFVVVNISRTHAKIFRIVDRFQNNRRYCYWHLLPPGPNLTVPGPYPFFNVITIIIPYGVIPRKLMRWSENEETAGRYSRAYYTERTE